MDCYTTYPSPLGVLTLASDGVVLTGLWMEGQKYFGSGGIGERKDDLPVFAAVKVWLDRYFAGEAPDPMMLPLASRGTDFQQKVWRQLLTIPCGTVITYGALARAVGCASARAVGSAVGKNPISIVVPCHRVVGSRGVLTGYAGGVARKRWLLAHEGIKMAKESCQDSSKCV